MAHLDTMYIAVIDFARSWLLFFFYLYIGFLAWPLKLWLRVVFYWIGIAERLPFVGPKVVRAKCWVTNLPVFSWALKQKIE